MQMSKLFKSSMVYSFGNILTKAVGFLLLPFYTRYLALTEYGTIELIELVINLTSIVFGLGILGGAMARIYHELTDLRDKHSVITSTLFVALVVSTCVAIIGLGFSSALSILVFKSNMYSSLISASISLLILTNIVEICMVYLRILDKSKLFVIIATSQFIAMAALNIYFIGFLKLGVWGFVYSKLIIYAVIALFLLYYVVKETGFNVRTDLIRKVLGFGLPLIGYAIPIFIIHFSDRFVLQHYHGLGEVGIYSIAYKLGFLITYIVGEPFGKVWNVRLYAHTNEDGWKNKFSDVFAYFVLALTLTWIVIGCFSHEILSLMVSNEYKKADVLIPLLALAYVFREIGDFFKQLLFINKKTALTSKVAMMSAVLNVGLNFAFIPSFGASGAMWATLLTWIFYAMMMYFHSQKEITLRYRPTVAIYLLLAIGLYVPVRLVEFSNELISFGFHLSISLIFALALILGRYFTPDEKHAIIQKCNLLLVKLFRFRFS